MVVEEIIKTAQPITVGKTLEYSAQGLRVITNFQGDVITIIPHQKS